MRFNAPVNNISSISRLNYRGCGISTRPEVHTDYSAETRVHFFKARHIIYSHILTIESVNSINIDDERFIFRCLSDPHVEIIDKTEVILET